MDHSIPAFNSGDVRRFLAEEMRGNGCERVCQTGCEINDEIPVHSEEVKLDLGFRADLIVEN